MSGLSMLSLLDELIDDDIIEEIKKEGSTSLTNLTIGY